MLHSLEIFLQPYLPYDVHAMLEGLIIIPFVFVFGVIPAVLFLKFKDRIESKPAGKKGMTSFLLLFAMIAWFFPLKRQFLLLHDGVTTAARVDYEETCEGGRRTCVKYEFQAMNMGKLRTFGGWRHTIYRRVGHFPKGTNISVTYVKSDPTISNSPPVSPLTKLIFGGMVLVEIMLLYSLRLLLK